MQENTEIESREPISEHSTPTPAGVSSSGKGQTAQRGKTKMEEQKREFLEYLPPETREYRYQGFEHLKETASQEQDRSQFIVFSEFPLEEVDKHEEDLPGRLDYCVLSETLVLKMPGMPREEAADKLGTLLMFQAQEKGIFRLVRQWGATRMKTPERRKEADRSWAPKKLPPGRTTQWPTVVLEVAYGESGERVKRDIAWWLHTGQVHLAISLDIKRPSGNLYITSWEQGNSSSIQNPRPQPQPLQKIRIDRGKHGQPPSMTGDDFIVPFERLMLRDPSEGEGDLVIKQRDLLQLAASVWEDMDMGM